MTEEDIARNERCLHEMLPEFAKCYPASARNGVVAVKIWARAVRSVIDMIEHEHEADALPAAEGEEKK